MRRFPCPRCETSLFFENHRCSNCGTEVAYQASEDRFVAVSDVIVCRSRLGPGACNWVAAKSARDSATDSPTNSPTSSATDSPTNSATDSATDRAPEKACGNCRLDLVADRSPLVELFQAARRRSLRQLYRLGLDPACIKPALRFRLLESTSARAVTTGHANGVITLDVAEGDPVRLAEIRSHLGERYRTPIGHVRHELGHWYWQALVDAEYSPLGRSGLDDFRAVFGDERLDYSEALAQHYASVDDGSWRNSHISHYASAHPWEDFAETFAHYLHLTDTLETARSFPEVNLASHTGEAIIAADFDDFYPQWLALTTVLNELNRSMGVPDAYPFAPSKPAIAKLSWLHKRLTEREPCQDQ